jgi:hypothetical protein
VARVCAVELDGDAFGDAEDEGDGEGTTEGELTGDGDVVTGEGVATS